MTFLNQLFLWLLTYQYAVLIPAMAVEAPITTILAGFLVSLGFLNGLTVYFVAVVVNVIGDSLYYALGRWGRVQFVNRWGKYIGLNPERLTSLEQEFTLHDSKILIVGKLTQGLGGLILIAAGAAHMPFKRFVWINFLCTIPKSLVLLLLGFYFGEAYNQINRYLNYTGVGMVILIVAFFIFYGFGVKRFTQRLISKNDINL